MDPEKDSMAETISPAPSPKHCLWLESDPDKKDQ